MAALPADLDAAVLVVLHVPPAGRSRLPDILSKAGPLPALPAASGAALEPGRVLVAPPDRHLLVREGSVLLSAASRENGHRPAVDALFRSAARWLGPRVVAVVLSGVLDDGAAGAAAVALQGGAVVVQDPAEALFDSMPRRARAAVPSALALPVVDLAQRLPALLRERAGAPFPPPSRDLVLETNMAQMDEREAPAVDVPGRPASVSCPACSGVMTEVRTGAARHYRCHVGHAYGPASLLNAQQEAAEAAVWTAVASMEERAGLHRELAEAAVEPAEREEHLTRAREVGEQANVLRRQLRHGVARA